MSLHRAVGALALAAFVLVGCQKTADKGKTEDQLVSAGFTKDQAKCITDDVWDKIPKSQRDKLTDKDAQLTTEQKTIFLAATVKCGRDKVIEQITSGLGSTLSPEQITCITGKLTDDQLVDVLNGKTDSLTETMTSCVTS
jgi:hypothetical protein